MPRLTAAGGRTAREPGKTLVRRWVAPSDGKVRLEGKYQPLEPERAGTAMVVGSRQGIVGRWTGGADAASTAAPPFAVRAGDTLDFFVEPREGAPPTDYVWRFTLIAVDSPAMGKMVWNSVGHFDGPLPSLDRPLSRKEQLAQVLLLTNEFAMMD